MRDIPAVHWLTFYQLSEVLEKMGMRCLDRFDMIDLEGLTAGPHMAVALARRFGPIRWLGHVLTPSTIVFAIKQ